MNNKSDLTNPTFMSNIAGNSTNSNSDRSLVPLPVPSPAHITQMDFNDNA